MASGYITSEETFIKENLRVSKKSESLWHLSHKPLPHSPISPGLHDGNSTTTSCGQKMGLRELSPTSSQAGSTLSPLEGKVATISTPAPYFRGGMCSKRSGVSFLHPVPSRQKRHCPRCGMWRTLGTQLHLLPFSQGAKVSCRERQSTN